ncbi:MAG: hypothetical protein EOM03_16845 [Clostridia bacterium]|nr:hypothetical protein [Clostridia bacterium]
MKKLLLTLAILSLLLAQTTANASGPIQLSADGKTVTMPVETFRARELDIQKGEAAIEYAAKLEGVIEELRNRLMVLESNLTQERRAADSFVKSEKRKAGTLGFVLGGIVGALATR